MWYPWLTRGIRELLDLALKVLLLLVSCPAISLIKSVAEFP